MASQQRKCGGPITRFVDWFMVDPITTGIVMAPLAIFITFLAYVSILEFLAKFR